MESYESERPASPAPGAPGQWPVLWLVFFGAMYTLARQFESFFPDTERVLRAVEPSAGVAVTALLLIPRRRWGATIAILCLAGIGVDLISGLPLAFNLAFSVIDLLQAAGCAWFIQWYCREEAQFARVRDVFALFGAASIVNGAGACLGAGCAYLSGTASFWDFYRTWWTADGLGIVLFTPLIVGWVKQFEAPWDVTRVRAVELGVFWTLWITLAWMSFHTSPYMPPAYLLILVVAWPALRFGLPVTSLALVILMVIVVTSSSVATGPLVWGGGDEEERLLLGQLFVAALSASGLLLSASHRESRTAIAFALEEQARFRALADNLPDGVVYQLERTPEGGRRFLYASAGSERLNGIHASEALANPLAFYDQILPEYRPLMAEAEAKSIAEGSTFKIDVRIRRPDGEIRDVRLASSPRLLPDGRMIWDGIETDITANTLAEQQIRESETNFRTFFETVTDMIIVGTLDGRILYTNASATRTLGFSFDELRSMNVADVHPPDLRNEASDVFAAMLRGERDTCPIPLVRKDGSLVPAETRVWFGRWNGQDCIFGITQNLTVTQEEQQRFERLFRNNPALMALTTLDDGRFCDVNDAFIKTIGYSRGELLGKTSADLNLFSHPEQQMLLAKKLVSEGHFTGAELQVRRKDGAILDGLFSGDVIVNQGRSYFLTVMSDITERNRVEQALRASETLHRTILKTAMDGFLRVDANGTILEVNDAYCRMSQFSHDELVGMSLLELAPDETEARARARQMATMARGEDRFETRHRRRDGSIYDVEMSLKFNVAQMDWVVAFVRDITDQKSAERIRQEAHDRMQKIASRLPGVVYQFALRPDGTSCFPFVSDAIREVFRVTPEEIAQDAQVVFARVHPDDLDSLMASIRLSAENLAPWQHEFRATFDDGNVRTLYGTSVPQRDDDGTILWHGFIADITARKKSEAYTAALALRNETLLQTACDGIHVLDEQGDVVEVNAAFCRMLGYSREEMLRKNVADWDSRWGGREFKDRVDELRNNPLLFETRHRRKDGLICDVEIHCVSVIIDGQCYLYAAARDITERKRAEEERERLERQNRQLQRSESLGRMAGAIAHHFNNQLLVVAGNLELALDCVAPSAEASEYLTEAALATHRASDVSSMMLTYLGQTYDERASLDLGAVCREHFPILRATMPETASLEPILPASGPVICGNANQIQQVLANLVTNAWESSEGAPSVVRVSISTAAGGEISDLHRYPVDARPGDRDYACLTVSDTGCGIDSKDLERIFDPFFSSRFPGRGLGLAVVVGIVRAHDGLITVESAPGLGSKFRVYFPVASPAGHADPVKRA